MEASQGVNRCCHVCGSTESSQPPQPKSVRRTAGHCPRYSASSQVHQITQENGWTISTALAHCQACLQRSKGGGGRQGLPGCCIKQLQSHNPQDMCSPSSSGHQPAGKGIDVTITDIDATVTDMDATATGIDATIDTLQYSRQYMAHF